MLSCVDGRDDLTWPDWALPTTPLLVGGPLKVRWACGWFGLLELFLLIVFVCFVNYNSHMLIFVNFCQFFVNLLIFVNFKVKLKVISEKVTTNLNIFHVFFIIIM